MTEHNPLKALVRDLIAAVDAFASGALPMEDFISEVLSKPEHRSVLLNLLNVREPA